MPTGFDILSIVPQSGGLPFLVKVQYVNFSDPESSGGNNDVKHLRNSRNLIAKRFY